jgi:cell shape-determining protein MreC
MKLYIIAILIFILSYFQVTKSLQLYFFNFSSPVIIFFKELSLTVKDLTVLVVNMDEVRKENIKLRQLISDLNYSKTVELLQDMNRSEAEILTKSFKESSLLRNKKIVLKQIIYYDSFKSKLILENNSSQEVKSNSMVLIGENIVGLVGSSNKYSIEVNLLSSKDLIINTNIINTSKFKIKTVLDSESGDSLTINNILTTEDVKVGDIVVTSNNNEFILPDLKVGAIQRIEGISSQTFRKAYINKNYDLNLKNFVGVMLNE